MTSLSRVPGMEQLLALTTAAAYGSMGAAGHHLGISQQAVSARFGGAEKLLVVTIFERSSTGVRPTGPGQLVLAWAHDVIQAAAVLDVGARGLRSTGAQLT